MSEIISAPSINDFHNSNFLVVFANMPGIENESDMAVIHNFIKDITLPSFSLKTMTTKHQAASHLHNMGSRNNEDLGDLSINFKLSEGMYNYFLFANYIATNRQADNISETPKMKDNLITGIMVDMLDNQKNRIGRISFDRVVPTTVSGLSLNYQENGIVDFSVTFAFEEFAFELL
jgi:hypothetical protein